MRGWAIQLACQSHAAPETLISRMVELAQSDPSPVVRLYLASAAQRLPAADSQSIVTALLGHSEDQSDQNLPLMDWFAAESLISADLDRDFALLGSARIPLVRGFLIRRLAHRGKPDVMARLVEQTVSTTQDRGAVHQALEEINNALRGERRVEMPKNWPPVFAALLGSDHAAIRSQAISLATTFGDPQAVALHRSTLFDPKAPQPERLAALAALTKVGNQDLAIGLQKLLADSVVRGAVLRALAGFDDAQTPAVILKLYPSLDAGERRDAVSTLASRPAYAKQLLSAVDSQAVPRSDISADAIRQLRNLKDHDIDEQLAKSWGAVRDTPADKAAAIAQLQGLLSGPPQPENAPDLALGRAVFLRTCQQCHMLFGTGGKVGPELTGSNRASLEYVLSNIIDPSALVGKDYQAHIISTTGGRVLTGLIRAADDRSVTLATATETIVLPKDEIDEDTLSDKSMMPDDLTKPLNQRELRSLVAYLASPAQTPLLATAETAALLFNGSDLTMWQGDRELWQVEAGEIVGKTAGLQQNHFLRSELIVADFRFSVQVKLVRNEGNSGIQFRSAGLDNGEVRGDQADIGSGWWGKLYEENGRGILSDRSGEAFVKPGEWNDYAIEAVGSRVRTWINGQPCVDLDDPAGAKSGCFALQLHAGGATEVRFKDFKLELLGLTPDGEKKTAKTQ